MQKMEQLFSITQNCDFTIRIRARRVGYNRYVGVSFDEMSGLIVNLINLPSQKTRLAYTVDEQGRLVIPVSGEGLACNLYGIEIIGFYNNGNWRHQIAPAFDIVKASAQDNYALCETDDCTLDFEITIGDTNVSTRLLTKSMDEHNNDQNAHPELVQALNNARQAIHDLQELIPQIENQIAEAGEVNDIQIDGQSILDQNKVANFNSDDFSHVNNIKVNGEPVIDENKEANIEVPTTVEELSDSSDFAKKTDLQDLTQQLEQSIEDAAVSEVEATVDNNTGTPEVDYSFENGKIQLDFKNLKGYKGEEGKQGIRGEKGNTGDSAVYNPDDPDVPDFVMANELGNSTTKSMTQKAITEEVVKIGSKTIDTAAEFEVADENSNAIFSVRDGHVKTKNFDSSEVPPMQETETIETDFALSDGTTDILRIKKGHVKTKNFDSEVVANDIEELKGENEFANKKIAIIGDSISTYQGWLPSDLPDYDGETYANYYPAHGYDVDDVSKTWWYIAATRLGISPSNIRNCAWSGSKVIGDSTSTSNAAAGCSSRRIADLGIGGAPDIVVIFISCNDFGGNIAVGDWQVNQAIPSDGEITTLREAYALMLSKIITLYPNARIFCCTILDERQRDRNPGWPTNNSAGVSTAEWNRNIVEIADAFGCDVINIHSCGMNYINISGYTCEPSIDNKLHPNAAGMRLIGNRVYKTIKNKY